MKKYCYSYDGEVFRGGYYDTIEECLSDAEDDSESGVYIGEVQPLPLKEMLPTLDWLIERIQQNLYEEVREVADTYNPELTSEQREKFQKNMTDFLTEEKLTYDCFRVVNDKYYEFKNTAPGTDFGSK